jgi:hypothetical protein
MNVIRRILALPLHPFLFAAYAVLFALCNNLTEIKPSTGLRAFLVGLLAALVLLLLARLVCGSWQRGAFLATWGLVLFFSYGHIHILLSQYTLQGVWFTRHRVFLVLWGVLFLGGLLLALKKDDRAQQWTPALNLIMLVLLIIPVYQIGAYSYNRYSQTANQNQRLLAALQADGIHSIAGQLQPPPKAELPDVYYIIMDSYSRSDILQAKYGFDNQPFLDFLQSRGFYIPQCARSNFPKTALSLSTSLNMDYLQNFGKELIAADQPHDDFGNYARYSTVRQTLHDLGYQVIAFKTGFSMIDFSDADIYYSPPNQLDEASLLFPGINSFEGMLVETSLLTPFQAQIDTYSLKAAHNKWIDHFNLRQYSFEKLNDVAALPRPKFVFAHLMATHPPFVMDAQGNFHVYPAELETDIRDGYVNSIEFANTRLEALVDQVLARPGPKPVIIIQADHGFGDSGAGTQILNAYYLPDGGEARLYPMITPVNTFRVVFDQYFGASLGLLPDRSYELGDQLYDFKPDIDPNPACW